MNIWVFFLQFLQEGLKYALKFSAQNWEIFFIKFEEFLLDIFQKWLLDTPVWLSPAYSGSLRRSLAHRLLAHRSWVAPVYPALVSSWQYIRRSMRKVGKARNTKQVDLHKTFDTMNHYTDWHLLPWSIHPKVLSLEKFWNSSDASSEGAT